MPRFEFREHGSLDFLLVVLDLLGSQEISVSLYDQFLRTTQIDVFDDFVLHRFSLETSSPQVLHSASVLNLSVRRGCRYLEAATEVLVSNENRRISLMVRVRESGIPVHPFPS